MKIYAEQTINLFQTGMYKLHTHQNQSGQGQQAGAIRQDTAVISPQGRSSSMLANLMSQKELIQANKDSLIERTLDEENAGSSAGLQEQLEEYEKQLDSIDKQIAAEMSKQAQGALDKDSTGQKRPDAEGTESSDDSLARLTTQAVEFDQAQAARQADAKREGEKKVCEAQIDSKFGSPAAEQKLDKLEQIESLTSQIRPLLWK